jgi:hypothetical protein
MLNNLQRRATLKGFFQRGSLPTEQNFAALIDSTVNRLDDGFTSSARYGLQLTAGGGRLTTYYASQQQFDAQRPAWFVELAPATKPDGLSFSQAIPPKPSDEATATASTAVVPGTSRLHLQAGGNVGVGTTDPTDRLDVRGFVASKGRIGSFVDAKQSRLGVPADGEWYPILTGLTGLQAFEIVAAAYGPPEQGRYALTLATVLSAFGKSNSRIYRKNAWFWGWFQKIQFRWTGDVNSYDLEMRTASSFGKDARIVYYVTCLFNDRRPLAPPPGTGL